VLETKHDVQKCFFFENHTYFCVLILQQSFVSIYEIPRENKVISLDTARAYDKYVSQQQVRYKMQWQTKVAWSPWAVIQAKAQFFAL